MDGSNFLDAAQVDELVAMYVAGKNMREIAEHFGVHRTKVSRSTCAAGRFRYVGES